MIYDFHEIAYCKKPIINALNCILIFIGLFGCQNSSKTYDLQILSCDPIIDGKLDDCWNNVEPLTIDGDLVGEIDWDGVNDLSAWFKGFVNEKGLNIIVCVTDDVGNSIVSDNVDYWENDNIEFFFSNSDKKTQAGLSQGDTIYYFSVSYKIDSLIEHYNAFKSGGEFETLSTGMYEMVEFGQNKLNGINTYEFLFPFTMGIFNAERESVAFNIEITDNDNEEVDDGFIKGRESGIAWESNSARNSYRETIHYGDLVFPKGIFDISFVRK